MTDFVHLHNHTDYSLLDGCVKIQALLNRAREWGMPAVAITDHGNMFGAIEFYTAGTKTPGTKPIIGYEAYVAPGSRHDKSPEQKDNLYHLTLLAKDAEGYRNLVALATAAFLEGFYHKPRIDRELLAAHHRGLVVLSGCIQSELSRSLLRDQEDHAKEYAGQLRELFGEDFFVELQYNGIEDQKKATERSIVFARKLGLPVVATNDTHYLAREDAVAHETLLCINTQSTRRNPKLSMRDGVFHFRSFEEMREAFSGIPEALSNTLLVAERCNLKLDLSTHHLPTFQPPDGLTIDGYLRKLAEEGAKRIYGQPSQAVLDRMNYELDVITKLGFAGYYLFVWDFVRYAREHGIPVGPGRGSGAGSLVAYLIGITQIDPLEYDLLFERFLNPERVSPPDFDIDFSEEGRGEVVKYVIEKYGADRVAQICSFGSLGARQVVRDVARVMEVPLEVAGKLANLIPNKIPDQPEVKLANVLEAEPTLRDLYERNPQIREVIDIALKLEGLSRHTSKHACGVVVADRPITEYMPLQKTPDGAITTQYDMKSIDLLKLMKADFLALANLTLIDATVKAVKKTHGIEIDVMKLPLDDPKTYELLRQGWTQGVFQLERPGFTALVKKLGPEHIHDIVALLALYRPGPLKSGLVDKFVNCRHGLEEPFYLHPALAPLLKETYGVIVYQEQVMRVVHDLGGFTLAESDIVRRAMGKKDPVTMQKYAAKFVEGCARKGVPPETANQIFDILKNFAEYGFNKSHAAAYALVSYWTAYLKANYPVEYMTALLNSEIGKPEDKLISYIWDCRRMGITVLPPSINESEVEFSFREGKMWFALSGVKGVGTRAAEAIVAERQKAGRFKSIFDFCTRVDLRTVNRGVIEALIKAGAFDGTGARRSQLLAVLEKAMQIGAREQEDRQIGQQRLFGDSEPPNLALPDLPEIPESELAKHEKEAFGFYLAHHPLAQHAAAIELFTTATIADMEGMKDGDHVTLGGMIVSVRKMNARTTDGKPSQMASFILEDTTRRCEAVIFPKEFKSCEPQLQEGSIALVVGKVRCSQNRVSVRAFTIAPIQFGIERYATHCVVRLEPALLNEPLLIRLMELARDNPGECPLYLDIRTAAGRRTVILADGDLKVNPTIEFVNAVRELVGRDRVKLGSKFAEASREA